MYESLTKEGTMKKIEELKRLEVVVGGIPAEHLGYTDSIMIRNYLWNCRLELITNLLEIQMRDNCPY